MEREDWVHQNGPVGQKLTKEPHMYEMRGSFYWLEEKTISTDRESVLPCPIMHSTTYGRISQ